MKSQQWRILKNPHLFIARAYGERTVPVLLLINIFPKQQQQQPQNNNKTEFRMRWSSWVIFLFGWIKIMIRQIVYHNQISWLCKVDVNLLFHLIKKKNPRQTSCFSFSVFLDERLPVFYIRYRVYLERQGAADDWWPPAEFEFMFLKAKRERT